MSQRVAIVSSDCHAGLALPALKDFMESEFHEQLDEYIGQVEAMWKAAREAKVRYRRFVDTEAIESMLSFAEQVSTDNERRLKELEADRVVAEVLFADTTSVPFTWMFGYGEATGGEELRLALAGQRAYNRWLCEFVDPSRQAGVALLNYADVDASIEEVRKAAAHGVRSVSLNGIQTNVPPPWHPSYTPLWNAIEEAEMPISFHGGAGTGIPTNANWKDDATTGDENEVAVGHYDAMTWATTYTEAALGGHRPLWFFIWGGVLERHPKLKLVFTEQGSGWIPKAVGFMNWQWDYGVNSEDKLLPRRPSEYYYEQCFAGASIMTNYEVAHRHEIGDANMMFGTDFPHPEGTAGRTVKYLNHVLSHTDITEAEARAIAGENCARVYGLDMAPLQALADTGVGPTLEEILTPLDDEVDPATEMWAAKASFLF
jgi:predicted TIM-barrel fold metal-dependent hydrolase